MVTGPKTGLGRGRMEIDEKEKEINKKKERKGKSSRAQPVVESCIGEVDVDKADQIGLVLPTPRKSGGQHIYADEFTQGMVTAHTLQRQISII